MKSARPVVTITFLFFTALAGFAQTATPESEKELSEARQAFSDQKYVSAIKHFKKANQLQHDSCFDCYIGMAKIYLAVREDKDAIKQAQHALAAATTDAQRVIAHNYQGMALLATAGDNKDKLSDSEREFRAAVSGDATCADCKFNLGYVLLKESKTDEGVDLLKAALPQFQGKVMERTIRRLIEKPERIKKDYPPSMTVALKDGEQLSLDRLEGKVVLLDFWGVWCPPCRESVPALKRMATHMDTSKVVLVSIDERDSVKTWKEFTDKNQMNWPQVYDQREMIGRAFSIEVFPTYFVLDRDGAIFTKISGWGKDQEIHLQEAIEFVLAQKEPATGAQRTAGSRSSEQP